MLLLVVMLNLLISIISESFDKISFERMESDSKLRLELIKEVENCIFWNRNKEDLRYITSYTNYAGEDVGEDEWESRIRLLYKNGIALKQ
mmetsp:Transcript_13512/g.2130  ORF Transcript_13512/g.2130 Transcript_13512/m.2130 type:complete len:90 (+) Transcript_13512:215-484(+)